MASKYLLENSIVYIDNTDIPKNKLNITDSDEIRELERELIEEAYETFYSELDSETKFERPISKNYTAEHLNQYMTGLESTEHLIWQRVIVGFAKAIL